MSDPAKSDVAFQHDIQEFYLQLDTTCRLHICCSCGEEGNTNQIPFQVEQDDDLLDPVRPHVVIVSYGSSSNLYVCRHCITRLKRGEVPEFAVANHLDFGDIPLELQNLSLVEQRMISIVLPIVSVYTKNYGGQTASRGNLIHFDNELQSIVKQLPRESNNLHIYEVDVPTGKGGLSTRRKRYRPDKVLEALEWLKKNNPLYNHIVIHEAEFRENYQQLELDSTNSNDDESYEDDNQSHPDGQERYISIDYERLESKEQEIVQKTLQSLALPRSKTVIRDMRLSEIMLKAFPWLFPYGSGGLEDDRRPEDRAIGNSRLSAYFKHLLHYHDRRFSKSHQFLFWMLKVTLKNRTVGVAVGASKRMGITDRQSGHDVFDPQAKAPPITKEQLQRAALLIGRDPSTIGDDAVARKLLDRLTCYGRSLPGTDAYMANRRDELLGMIKATTTMPAPTLFFTLSSSDLYWPELYRMIRPDLKMEQISQLDLNQCRILLTDNPVLAATE